MGRMNANTIIDALGGTKKVAELCRVSAPSVSEWRRVGIPDARLMYLQVVRPDVFANVSAGDAAQEKIAA